MIDILNIDNAMLPYMVYAIVAYAIYCFLTNRLITTTESYRRDNYLRIESLLKSGKLGPQDADVLAFAQSMHYQRSFAWRIAFSVIPIVVRGLLSSRNSEYMQDCHSDTKDDEARHRAAASLRMATQTILCLSPGALILFLVQVMALILFGVSVGMIIKLLAIDAHNRHQHQHNHI